MEIAVTKADERARLVFRYKVALHEWSLARFHHSSDSPEVVEAKQTLERLEDALHLLRGTSIVKYQSSPEQDRTSDSPGA
jgi:hypothetical protein